jgi:hypothetical protein
LKASVKLFSACEHVVSKRMAILLSALHELSGTMLRKEVIDPLIKSLVSAFTALNELMQLKLRVETRPESDFVSVINWGSRVHESLGSLQLIMDKLSDPGRANKSNRKGKLKKETKKEKLKENGGLDFSEDLPGINTKILREARLHAKLTSQLVLQAEQFDINVINLSKRFKVLNRFIKRSAIRDFKIHPDSFQVEAPMDPSCETREPPLKKSRSGKENHSMV